MLRSSTSMMNNSTGWCQSHLKNGLDEKADCARQSQRNAEAVSSQLPQGKLNAVRAAFKAGVTPARIAREFGISRSDVQRALAGDAKR